MQEERVERNEHNVQVIQHTAEEMKREVAGGLVRVTAELTVDPYRALDRLKRDVVEYSRTHTLEQTMVLAGGTLDRQYDRRNQGITLPIVLHWLREAGLPFTQQDEIDRAWDVEATRYAREGDRVKREPQFAPNSPEYPPAVYPPAELSNES